MKLQWFGEDDPGIGEIKLDSCGGMVIGRYGGHPESGAYKNEDGAMLAYGTDWEFTMILDGHNSAQSVQLVMKTIDEHWPMLETILKEPLQTVFRELETHLLTIFESQVFLEECKQIQGETACLLSVRKENYLWWFSVGDCQVYLLHEELHKLGQYALNQRQFFEWIGEVNTFSKPVPCYSSGVRELRSGHNRMVVLTDGVLECGARFYESPLNLYNACFEKMDIKNVVTGVLQYVHDQYGRDSATMICWDYHNPLPGSCPSNLI
jgi:hypothetical protein